jgi:hypothetical protein
MGGTFCRMGHIVAVPFVGEGFERGTFCICTISVELAVVRTVIFYQSRYFFY